MASQAPIEGTFPLDKAIIRAFPHDVTVLSAERLNLSSNCTTAKISVLLHDGAPAEYFLKVGLGPGAKTDLLAAHFNSTEIAALVPNLTPAPVAKGEYITADGDEASFSVLEFRNMDTTSAPDPAALAAAVAELHTTGISPNGMFGWPIVTGRGTADREEHWSYSWADQFTHLLKDLIKMDNQTNDWWPEYDAACKQLINRVIPRLLGALQSEGRDISPVLVHGDLWEGNVATDMETGKIIIFDNDECMYAHNEMEFGTWRCKWATYFQQPIYIQQYWMKVERSEPVEEWDDRNRLYSIKTALCESAGHRGSSSRQLAYNDMLFLCEKYAPLPSLEAYDPQKDIVSKGVQEWLATNLYPVHKERVVCLETGPTGSLPSAHTD